MGSTDDQAIETLYALGHWLLGQDRAPDALHVFRTMLAAAPQDERSWLGLGVCHERTGTERVAEALYALAERALPQSYRCSLAQARLARERDAAVAEIAYERAEERAAAVDEHEIAASIARERSIAC